MKTKVISEAQAVNMLSLVTYLGVNNVISYMETLKLWEEKGFMSFSVDIEDSKAEYGVTNE